MWTSGLADGPRTYELDQLAINSCPGLESGPICWPMHWSILPDHTSRLTERLIGVSSARTRGLNVLTTR